MDSDPRNITIMADNGLTMITLDFDLDEEGWSNNTLAKVAYMLGKATRLPVDHVTVENSVMAFGSNDEMWPVE